MLLFVENVSFRLISSPFLTIGSCLGSIRRGMGARGRLLSTTKPSESHEAIAECDSSFWSPYQLPKCIIHGRMLAMNQLLRNIDLIL